MYFEARVSIQYSQPKKDLVMPCVCSPGSEVNSTLWCLKSFEKHFGVLFYFVL